MRRSLQCYLLVPPNQGHEASLFAPTEVAPATVTFSSYAAYKPACHWYWCQTEELITACTPHPDDNWLNLAQSGAA